MRLVGISAAIFGLSACASTIDRFTIDRVLDRGTDFADLGIVCGVGHALTHPLGSVARRDPSRAMVVSETVAALCAEEDAWKADLDQARVMRNLRGLGSARADEAVDARLRGQRLHTLAASRFERGWQHLLEQYPGLDQGECPRIKSKDEFVVVLGLVGSTLALFHDRAGGGVVGVPTDRPLAVARASSCFAPDAWWSTPQALQAGAWATVPGSAPEGVDPWELLEQAATNGETTGIRVARAIQVIVAANAGRDDVLATAIPAFVASTTPPDPDWLLLDEYARLVTLNQSDLIWTRERGHRTEVLGVLPSDEQPGLAPVRGEDPFGFDPFGTEGESEEESP